MTTISEGNGALIYKTGSHLEGFAGPHSWNNASYATVDAVQHDLDDPDVTTIPQEMGDVLLHTQHVHHASHSVSGDAVRWSVEVRYQYNHAVKEKSECECGLKRVAKNSSCSANLLFVFFHRNPFCTNRFFSPAAQATAEDPVLIEQRQLSADATSWNYFCCLLYTSPSPRDKRQSRMPSSA